MIQKILNFIKQNRKTAIGYGLCFILSFGLVAASEEVPSDDIIKNIDDNKLLIQGNNDKIASNLEEKERINTEIEILTQEIDKLTNELNKIEEEKSNLINLGFSAGTSSPTATNTGSASSGNISVHFLNTGNSDSILIKGEKTVLIDGADNNDEAAIVSYLNSQGVSKIDYIIATHPHADHVGGLDAVINSLSVGQVFVANGSSDSKTYTDFINAVANKGLSPSVPLDGAKFDLGSGSYIQIYNTNGGSDANNQSLVTLLVNGNDKALFMGDAESSTENEILSKLGQVDLLKVGHHGSKTGTSSTFLNKINPKYAVLTTGTGNQYKHPHSDTMLRLKTKGVEVHRTDECGHVIFSSNGSGFSTSCVAGSYNAGA